LSDSTTDTGGGAAAPGAPAIRQKPSDILTVLREPATIRARCAAITQAVDESRSGLFRIDRGQLPIAAARVVKSIRSRYPDLNIPYHSRWRHFEAGGVDRKAELDALISGLDVAEQARARFDLTVVSVLLDAGAGAQWRFVERAGPLPAMALPPQRQGRDDLLSMLDQAATGKAPVDKEQAAEQPPVADAAAASATYARSEGLAVASFRAFVAGAFSSVNGQPCRADAAALRMVDAAALRSIFQVSPANPLVGLEGRAGLLSRLGEAMQAEGAREGLQARPGLIYDRITANGARHEVAAADVLKQVLRSFAPIWQSGSKVMGLPAGDVWPHLWAGEATGEGPNPQTEGWVPFHKLSQWLTYSLIEPLQWAGVKVTGLDALTGLPEYRNGGLLLDTGVIVPRRPASLDRTWRPADEFIVEWRALTVTLLDELAVLVRQQLGKSAEEMPLACILEGGTWAAGREIAGELRDGAPPVKIDSDGTVF